MMTVKDLAYDLTQLVKAGHGDKEVAIKMNATEPWAGHTYDVIIEIEQVTGVETAIDEDEFTTSGWVIPIEEQLEERKKLWEDTQKFPIQEKVFVTITVKNIWDVY